MLRVLQYNEIERTEWGRLVQISSTGTWFQTPEACDFFASMPELFRPFAIGLKNDGDLRAVCCGYITVERNALQQFFTRRAIIMGGPALANDATDEEVEMLMMTVRKEVKRKAIYMECRNFNDYSRWKTAFKKAGFEYQPHLNFHVDCSNKDLIWEQLSENRKRQIRKAQATVECLANERVNESDVLKWYEILRELYRTKVKTPLWPVEFFIEAYRQNIGRFLLVKYEGKVIGGSMLVQDGKSTYEWFECGRNAMYKEQYPSVMATWVGMTLAHEAGCERYDMMGAGEPGKPYGVRDFKSEFGGELVEHGRFLCVTKPLLYKVGKFGVWMLKKCK